MQIKVLVENTSVAPSLRGEHGLSIYIETLGKKLLFDTGASGLFLENAKKMGVSIRDVDLAVISHGHYDHGGGLRRFLEENTKARVYIHKQAFEGHFAKRPEKTADIGIDKDLKKHDRIILNEGIFPIDENLLLFSEVPGSEFLSSCNRYLFAGNPDRMVPDNFGHEQNLILTENGKTVLIAGCAHRGIVNIYKSALGLLGKEPDCVIGGFHLYNHGDGKTEDPDVVRSIGEFLKSTGSKYYTGHCTGLEAYQLLKTVMGDQIQYLSTGSVTDL